MSALNRVAQPVRVYWGGFSVVEATVRLYEAALGVTGPEDHIVLLSGQCYPAWPVGEFAAHLAAAPHRQHCRAALLLDGTLAAGQILRRWLFDTIPAGPGPGHLARATARRAVAALAPRRRPEDFAPLAPVAGSQWTA